MRAGVSFGCSAHTLIHRFVGELVGFFVTAPQGVAHLESLQPGSQAFGLFPEGAQAGAGDFVLPVHLLDHQFRVGDDAKAPRVVFIGPGQHRKQA